MRVLHLFSNWKWTGPAEPAVILASQFLRAGHVVRFFCGTTPDGSEGRFAGMASERGIEVETPLELSKHRRLVTNMSDAAALGRILGNWLPEIIHCHMTNDTRIALRAAEGRARPLVVRSIYEGSPSDVPGAEPTLLGKVDGVIAASAAVAEWLPGRAGIKPERVRQIDTAIDLGRFHPTVKGLAMRKRWGVPEDAPVLGVVARIQKRRRFDLLLRAFEEFLGSCPEARLVIVGRGTKQLEVVEDPVRELGIAENVVLAGYLEGDDYARALAAFDALVYLVPGTDGSCRTVREAMAVGVPVIASRRGMLPELVAEGITGLAVDEYEEDLREAFERILCGRAEERREMGRRATQEAIDRFSPQRQADAVKHFYGELLCG